MTQKQKQYGPSPLSACLPILREMNFLKTQQEAIWRMAANYGIPPRLYVDAMRNSSKVENRHEA